MIMKCLAGLAQKRCMNAGGKIVSLRDICVMSITLLVLWGAPVSAEKTVTLSAHNYWPWLDDAHPQKGLFGELASEAYKAVGYEAVFRFYPLARSTAYVLTVKELEKLGSQRHFLDKSGNVSPDIQAIPVFWLKMVGFYLKDHFRDIRFTTLKDLRGYRIGVIRGGMDTAILQRDEELTLEEVNTLEQLFKKLYAGRNDIVFVADLSGQTTISKLFPDDRDRFVMTEDILAGTTADCVFSKKYPNYETYVEKFEEGLNLIKENGTYFKIFEKYYGEGNVPADISDIEKEDYMIPKE
jgi:polar amino acid transport system substrate-binding protein